MEQRNQILGEMCFDERLVALGISAETDQEVLDAMAAMMLREGMVKESFAGAVKAREQVYATGLELVDMSIAVPHTDVEHVVTPAIALGILAKPVKFGAMGEADRKIDVEIVFMLAIKEAHAQLTILQALMKIFSQEGTLTALKNCKTPKEAADMLTGLMNGKK